MPGNSTGPIRRRPRQPDGADPCGIDIRNPEECAAGVKAAVTVAAPAGAGAMRPSNSARTVAASTTSRRMSATAPGPAAATHRAGDIHRLECVRADGMVDCKRPGRRPPQGSQGARNSPPPRRCLRQAPGCRCPCRRPRAASPPAAPIPRARCRRRNLPRDRGSRSRRGHIRSSSAPGTSVPNGAAAIARGSRRTA